MKAVTKIAYIDLTREKVKIKPTPDEWVRYFLGGRGFGALMLYSLIGPGIEPFSPENVLIVNVGLLAGVPMSSGRVNIGAKSPLTGALGSSNIGGHFGPELRCAGFDHLIIVGKAKKPVYLWISDGNIEIKNATGIWGMNTVETQEAIRSDLGDPLIQCLVIGPAGERLVRFANIRTGFKSSAGRTGMGAVMGSKNLKAIATRGSLGIEFAYPDKLLELCMTFMENLKKTRFFTVMKAYGTKHIFSYTNTLGIVRAKNAQLNQLFPSDQVEAEAFKAYNIGHEGCYACPIQCRDRYIARDPEGKLYYDEGPEYTSQGAWGSMPYINDTECILYCNHLVNIFGLDTLSTGNMIAWAIELFEKGLIDQKLTDGMILRWGDKEVLYELIRKIAFREGFGDILAEGPIRAIEKLGNETAYYNLHVKGLDWLQTEDRVIPSFALGCSVSTRGADHLRSRPAIDLFGLPEEFLEKLCGGPVSSDYRSYDGKARMIHAYELEYAVIDSLGLCKFVCSHFITPHSIYRDTFNAYNELSELIYYAIGMKISGEELRLCGERIYTLERMFNVREGFTRKDDYPPERYFKEPLPTGLPAVRGRCLDREKYEKMLDEYYELHNWDKNGIPSIELREKLKLREDDINELKKMVFE